ncbi:acyclic terpene utilization AtuA family protein [Burkholderia sp. S171]|uniref:acyclic terpene utilization AtuA family protein n=1 Tax=Burkholderia sp. S171 TaxID=1641860 RepID=UPI00131BC8A2|nr:acyclic terpene utilization AtuA family protein [Burkholderia sp. S171]
MEIRVLAGNGCLGTGFKPESLERGVTMKPHVIACDAGSTDSGPSSLGAGRPKLSREACKRDLRLLLIARDRLQVPLIVGSCGTSGRDVGVEWVTEMALEIADEENLSFRLAAIKSDQQPAYLKQQLANGLVRPLQSAPPIDASTFDSPVVGMMGTEPIMAAIEQGAQVILAGRASDSALYAAVPVALGADPGLAWHAAKTLECGAACAVVPAADSMFATIRDDHFDIEPLDPEARCTPLGIAAHTLYENANPFLLTEPGGVIDTEAATYEALDERRVRVRGSRFHPSDEYTIKLEGAAIAGYQTVIVGGVRDPHVIKALPSLVQRAQAYFRERVTDLFGDTLKPGEYDIEYRLYGIDGVMGHLEPQRDSATPRELGILITVTAPSQEQANKIASLVAHVSAHLPVPAYEGIVSTIAYPYSPPEIPRGAVYRFTLNHVNVPGTPLDMFRTTFIEV